jgi:hypothetical protein
MDRSFGGLGERGHSTRDGPYLSTICYYIRNRADVKLTDQDKAGTKKTQINSKRLHGTIRALA